MDDLSGYRVSVTWNARPKAECILHYNIYVETKEKDIFLVGTKKAEEVYGGTPNQLVYEGTPNHFFLYNKSENVLCWVAAVNNYGEGDGSDKVSISFHETYGEAPKKVEGVTARIYPVIK